MTLSTHRATLEAAQYVLYWTAQEKFCSLNNAPTSIPIVPDPVKKRQ